MPVGRRRDGCERGRRSAAGRGRRPGGRRRIRAVAGGQEVALRYRERRIAKGAGRRHGRVDGLEVGIVGLADALGGGNHEIARVAAQTLVHGGDIVAVAAAGRGRRVETGAGAGRVGVEVVGERCVDRRRLEKEEGEQREERKRREPPPTRTLSASVHCVRVEL